MLSIRLKTCFVNVTDLVTIQASIVETAWVFNNIQIDLTNRNALRILFQTKKMLREML